MRTIAGTVPGAGVLRDPEHIVGDLDQLRRKVGAAPTLSDGDSDPAFGATPTAMRACLAIGDTVARDEDLLAGVRTTLARIKAAAEAEVDTTPSIPGTTRVTKVSER